MEIAFAVSEQCAVARIALRRWATRIQLNLLLESVV
jgi:hypothetical protein